MGVLHKTHNNSENATYWPNRYNDENFIVGSDNSLPDGFTFNEWVNYLFDFENEIRDNNTYPIET